MTVDVLGDHGVVRMDGDQVRGFLRNQTVGVLGLPAEGAPYLVPLSYGYDGEDTLYFTYVVGTESRKAALSELAEAARFLVFHVDTPFNWASVLLTGTVDEVPESRWDDLEAAFADAWDPDLFQTAKSVEDVRVFAFDVEESVGIKHTGLPPGFATDRAE
ncbi:pyridoxamine 5'-phosphate oxidase family protein [Halobacteriales archaeon Cl-PHB]